MRRLSLLSVAIAVVLSVPSGAAQKAATVAQYLSPGYPSEIASAHAAERIAWAAYEEGKRNVYTAVGPAFTPVRLTSFMRDDGTDLTTVRISADGSTVAFVRGHAPNRDGWVANPSSDPDGAEREIWAAKIATPGTAWKLAVGAAPEIAPDGSSVIFARDGQIYRARVTGVKPADPMDRGEAPFIKSWGTNSAPRFSPDGKFISFVSQRVDHSYIGIYDVAAGYRRIGEFSSGGIGPHDLALLEGGRVLVVANGGLREHPDIGGGRRILNPDAIETTLAYIDLRTGSLLERHDLGAAGTLSLRHLDVARDGTVIVGAQIVSGPTKGQPLVYRHRRQQQYAAFALPAEVGDGLSGYVSSIACDRAGGFVAVTSSRGALAVVIDIVSGRVTRTRRLEDVSGVAPTPGSGSFLTTSGLGRVTVVADGSTADRGASTPWAWDNHAVLVAGDPDK